jgi:hypothetical protein
MLAPGPSGSGVARGEYNGTGRALRRCACMLRDRRTGVALCYVELCVAFQRYLCKLRPCVRARVGVLRPLDELACHLAPCHLLVPNLHLHASLTRQHKATQIYANPSSPTSPSQQVASRSA